MLDTFTPPRAAVAALDERAVPTEALEAVSAGLSVPFLAVESIAPRNFTRPCPEWVRDGDIRSPVNAGFAVSGAGAVRPGAAADPNGEENSWYESAGVRSFLTGVRSQADGAEPEPATSNTEHRTFNVQHRTSNGAACHCFDVGFFAVFGGIDPGLRTRQRNGWSWRLRGSVPQGRPKIAQRFIAGAANQRPASPAGTKELRLEPGAWGGEISVVPCGTGFHPCAQSQR